MSVSKELSYLLRHGARGAGLAMDPAGWAAVSDVCRIVRISPAELDAEVANNTKSRLEREGDRIRCAQGHSLDGCPVTLEALEASWQPWTSTEPIVHGTSVEAAEQILREGIQPMARTHVHLAEGAESEVGKRSHVAVHLWVDPTALAGVWVSGNGVILTRAVPPGAIIRVEGQTKRGRAAEARLAACLQSS